MESLDQAELFVSHKNVRKVAVSRNENISTFKVLCVKVTFSGNNNRDYCLLS